MAWVSRTNADEVYGVSEKQLYDEWFDSDGERSLTEYLQSQYQKIADANPGEWKPKEREFFQAMAKTILYDMRESHDYDL